MKTLTERWWEAVNLLLAANSILFGVLGVRAESFSYAIFAGFLPGVLLTLTVLVHNRARRVASVLAVIGSLGAAVTIWMVYPIVLGLIVVSGGLLSGKLGVTNPQPV